MENKKGWIKIVESIVAIMLLSGVMFIAVGGRGSIGGGDDAEIRKIEIDILRKIELTNSFRVEIVGTNGEIEFANFPNGVKNEIISETPSYLTCTAKICNPEDDCLLTESQTDNVYTETVMITSNLEATAYKARVLKMFCWEN